MGKKLRVVTTGSGKSWHSWVVWPGEAEHTNGEGVYQADCCDIGFIYTHKGAERNSNRVTMGHHLAFIPSCRSLALQQQVYEKTSHTMSIQRHRVLKRKQ